MSQTIRIATRTSQLAMWQAEEVKRLLLAQDVALDVELVPIKSDGDIQAEQSFDTLGYKGIFTKRIEAALLDGRADIAVHSMKDLHSELPDATMVGAVLTREDPRDAFISAVHHSLQALPEGACVGTASVRRAAQLKHLRPDLNTTIFRGNVPTRLEKLQRGDVDARLLAVAGLTRLGMQAHITEILPTSVMLPAVCQGIIAIECRKADADIRALLQRINHPETMHASLAERAMLAALDGDCKTPLAGLAELNGDRLTLKGQWIDDARIYEHTESGRISDAQMIGRIVGAKLKEQMR
jgi:hydroxymethylbilane synthase